MRARQATRLLCAAAFLLVPVAGAAAQTAGSAELDPSAPLDPMDDLGVAWPDMQAPDAAAPPAAVDQFAAAAPADGASERRYTVALDGLAAVAESDALVAAFDRQSALRAGRGDAANAAQIERRSDTDAELLAELLRAQGYYDAVVEPRIDSAGAELNVVLVAAPGAQYRFAAVDLPGLDQAGTEANRLRRAFAVKPGDPVVAADVLAAGVALEVALGEQGFATARVGDRVIEVDHEALTATLVLPVEPGPIARFGAIRVEGRPPFSAAHLGRIARFRRGEPFQRSKADDLRRALVATGLVASAEVRVVHAADGRTVDLAVRLDPAPPRTVAGELGYGTGEGIRAELSWQHRNLFNPEGALTVRAVAGTQEQVFAVNFRRNNFRARDQILNAQASVSHIDHDAYEAKTVQISGGLERQSNFIWHKKWTWSVGAELLATDERGVFTNLLVDETRTFLIAAAPASLYYDGSDDLLDPTRGFRLGGRISPEISARGARVTYARAQLDASVYQPIAGGTVGAARVRLGTIVGAEASALPPSRRFYSGGGGSVRGYGYQRLGPRAADDDPIGGRGLAEFSLEARIRLKALGGNFGIVPFLDGGTLTGDLAPDFGDWRFGAGLGLRYYSSFGPIRLDLGTPLNRRPGDSRLAVTVSLGQAF